MQQQKVLNQKAKQKMMEDIENEEKDWENLDKRLKLCDEEVDKIWENLLMPSSKQQSYDMKNKSSENIDSFITKPRLINSSKQKSGKGLIPVQNNDLDQFKDLKKSEFNFSRKKIGDLVKEKEKAELSKKIETQNLLNYNLCKKIEETNKISSEIDRTEDRLQNIDKIVSLDIWSKDLENFLHKFEKKSENENNDKKMYKEDKNDNNNNYDFYDNDEDENLNIYQIKKDSEKIKQWSENNKDKNVYDYLDELKTDFDEIDDLLKDCGLDDSDQFFVNKIYN